MKKELIERNALLIEKYTKDNNEVELLKQKMIRELLKDENCFNKMTIEQAFSIFDDLGYTKEESKDLYVELTDL